MGVSLNQSNREDAKNAKKDMSFRSLLGEHRERILERWFERIADGYPAETASFLKKQQNRFSNPVGHALIEGTAALFDALPGNNATEKPLELIIKIRAVQDGRPSDAIGFIYLLKDVIREVLGDAVRQQGLWDELTAIDSRIDRLALAAFDMYMADREKIYEIRANAARRQYEKLMERAIR
jgi:hypothetical protein